MKIHWKTVAAWIAVILGLTTIANSASAQQKVMYGPPPRPQSHPAWWDTVRVMYGTYSSGYHSSEYVAYYALEISVRNEAGKPLRGIEGKLKADGETAVSDKEGKLILYLPKSRVGKKDFSFELVDIDGRRNRGGYLPFVHDDIQPSEIKGMEIDKERNIIVIKYEAVMEKNKGKK